MQTAKVCEAEEFNEKIGEAIKEILVKKMPKAPAVPMLPKKVTYEMISSKLKSLESVPIGISKQNLTIQCFNFAKEFITLVTSKLIENAAEFISNLVTEFNKLNINLAIFDAERIASAQKDNLKDAYNLFEYEAKNGINKELTLCIIIGFDKFLEIVEKDDSALTELLKSVEERGLYNFIFVENTKKLKAHEYDTWYRNYIIGDTGIYVGNGIEDQYLISVDTPRKELENSCSKAFGYPIKGGLTMITKLVEMIEEDE